MLFTLPGVNKSLPVCYHPYLVNSQAPESSYESNINHRQQQQWKNHAFQMLEAGENGTAAGGMIMVFTDGEETLDRNLHPTIKEITPVVFEKESIIHGLLMSGVTDDHDLIKLAIKSGGDFCIFEDSGDGGTDFYQCLMGILESLDDYATVEVREYSLNFWVLKIYIYYSLQEDVSTIVFPGFHYAYLF